ncbi:hypothetical protein ElyMa_003425200 [Elysia marginata]|uniref:C-type lectin domain-containing protein n=1 Tax=Elysia marginata TaxID=1093978 RepID=A0AAV4JTV7_9GAST|nr:hypothetical protein ElyMa_003425200 [Elysia marginata]
MRLSCSCQDLGTTTSFFFKKTTDDNCRKGQLSSPWTTRSKILCFVECVTRFQDRCTNVVFNSLTLDCTPVHPVSRDVPTLTIQPDDVLYSKVAGRDLNCDTAAGFMLHEKCGTAACISNPIVNKDYDSAKIHCRDVNAFLFMPNTWDKFALLESIVSQSHSNSYTWVALFKPGHLPNWFWDHVQLEQADANFLSPLWAAHQPNSQLDEVCGFFSNRQANYKLHDASCTGKYRFLCEQNY